MCIIFEKWVGGKKNYAFLCVKKRPNTTFIFISLLFLGAQTCESRTVDWGSERRWTTWQDDGRGGESIRTASLRFVIDLSLRRAKLWPFYFLRQTAEERIPAACWLNLDTEVSDSLRWKIFHSKCKKNNNIADIFIFTPLILFQIYGGLQGLFNFFLAFLHGGR